MKQTFTKAALIKKSNNAMSVMLSTRATFLKKNSYLVAETVSFDTAGPHLLTFRFYSLAIPVQRY